MLKSDHSDSDNVTSALANLQRRWMIGQSEAINLKQLPESWEAAFQALPKESWNLAALAWGSQFDLMVMRPELSGEVSTRAELPELTLPILPNALRPLFRSVLSQSEREQGKTLRLFLTLLQERGYVAHPVDWLPQNKSIELPTVYWPWLQWMHQHNGTDVTDGMETVDVDNWDDYYPAARVLLLKAQRQQDSQSTRALIERCMSREAAEQRLKILQVLEDKLSKDDVSFLSSLQSDRSGKVTNLAKQYLQRLGELAPALKTAEAVDPQTTQELAQQYKLGRASLFKKGQSLKPIQLKSKKQQAIRTEQIGQVDLLALAAELKLSLAELIDVWAFDANRTQDNFNFIQNAVNSMSDDHIEPLINKLLKSDLDVETELLDALKLLWPRLNSAQQLQAFEQLLGSKQGIHSFQAYLELLDKPLTESVFNIRAIKSSAAWKALTKDIKDDVEAHGYINNYANLEAILALGLLASKPVAGELLELLQGLGINKADPVLDSIKINFSL